MFAIPKLFVSLHPQTKIIGLWCNGNTTDSGPVIQKPAKTAILAGFLFFVVYFQVGKAQKKESSKMNGKLFLHPHRLGDVFLHL